MKTWKLYATAFLLSLSFASCSDDEEDEAAPGTLTAKVDNTTWKADLTSALYSEQDKVISVGGYTAQGKSVSVSIMGITGTGSYTSTSPIHVVIGTYTEGEGEKIWTSEDPGDVLVTITKLDKAAKRVSGTFEFVAVADDQSSTKTITEGKFENVLIED
ncbi:MAG: DUF6252 family protein [Rufibacter sp.]